MLGFKTKFLNRVTVIKQVFSAERQDFLQAIGHFSEQVATPRSIDGNDFQPRMGTGTIPE